MRTEIEGGGGRGTVRESRIAPDDEAGDMAELEAALSSGDDDEDEGEVSDGLDGLDALGVNTDEIRGQRRQQQQQQRGPGKGQQQRGQRQQQRGAGDDQLDDLEPLSVEEYQNRHRQTSAALKQTRQEMQALREASARRDANFERLVGILQGSGRLPADGQQQQQRFPQSEAEIAAMVKKDPVRALQAMIKRVADYEAEAETTHRAQAQNQRMSQAVADVQNHVRNDEAAFERVRPDYHDASAFLIEQRIKTAVRMGIPEDAAKQAVFRELIQAGVHARATGANSAQLIYEAAMDAGYTPGRGPSGGGQRQQQRGGGQQQQQRDPLQHIRDGVRNSRSAGGGGGGGGDNDGGLVNILDLEGGDFDAAADKLLKNLRRGRA